MKYFIASDISKKFRISVKGVKFSNAFVNLKYAPKLCDSRCKTPAEKHRHLVLSHENSLVEEELLLRIIETFPYPIQVSNLDGTLIFVNEEFLKFFHILNEKKLMEEYNMLDDPFIKNLGIEKSVLKAFKGQTVHLYDIKVPVQGIINKFGKGQVSFNSVFLNITSYPIYNGQNQLSCVVSVFITSKLYSGREEIIKGKEYIENHWKEKFDINAAAEASGFSKTQFTRLFESYTDFTPHRYYMNIKINILKDKLLDNNLSISQAFSACGLDYNGHYAKVFKTQVGITPSAYRKSNI